MPQSHAEKNQLLLTFAPIVFVVAGLFLLFRYWKFRNRPEFKWLQRLKQRRAELQTEIGNLVTENQKANPSFKFENLKEQFEKYKASISINELTAYSGIGPGTVERLTNAGVSSLAQADGYNFDDIPGFGPVKSRDIENAVTNLVRERFQKFFSGQGSYGQAYRESLANFDASIQKEMLNREARLIALNEALTKCNHLVEQGKWISFFNSLSGKPLPGISPELLSQPVPPSTVPSFNDTPMAQAKPSSQADATIFPEATAPVVKPSILLPAPSASPQPTKTIEPKLEKLQLLTRFGFMVAKVEGRIAKDERKRIREFLVEQFSFDQSLLRYIDPMMEQVEKAIPLEDEILPEVGRGTTEVEKLALYQFAVDIADASGDRNMKEEELLGRLRTAFSVPQDSPAPLPPPTTAQAPIPTPAKPQLNADARQLLEIEPGMKLSVDLIRRKYNLLTSKLDPAKAEALGPEFAKMVNDKRTAIRQAAEELLLPLGQPLEIQAAPPPPSDIRHNPDLDAIFGL